MKPFSVTLRNFRCFEDRAPATLEIRPGFTALLEPNNSGKSTLLKAFYELRPLFSALRVESDIGRLIGKEGIPMSFLGIADPTEVSFNRNDRSLSVVIEFADSAENQPHSVEFQLDRFKQAWFAKVILHPKTVQLRAVSWNNQWRYETSAGIREDLDLIPLLVACNVLAAMMYVGPYRNAINVGSGPYYDLSVGTQFIADWDDWKTGPFRNRAEAMQRVTEDIARIFGYRRIEISAAENRSALQIAVDGKPYRLHELGAGLTQFIIVLACVAVKKPSFLLIDEPELNFAPIAANRLLDHGCVVC